MTSQRKNWLEHCNQGFHPLCDNESYSNSPDKVQDIKNAKFVWGPELGCLKGKTTRQPLPRILNGQQLNTTTNYASV